MDAWWVKAYPDEKYRKDVTARWMGHLGKALVENSEIAGDEYQVTCKDGTVKTMFIFGVPVASKVFAMFNDVTTMKQLQRDLEASRDELERKVKDRTVKLQALAEEIIRVENRERLRIAHVLHEDLQQWLAAAKFRLGELQELDATTSFRESAKRVHQMLDKAIAVTRSLAVDLRPPIIHEEGLKRALRWLADDMRKKFDMSVQIRVDRIIEKIGKEIGLFVFEAVRELLLNVVKHAGVKTVAIEVKAQGRGRFKVEVSDQGNGFDSSRDDDRKFGLFSIRERADVLGGELDIVSKPGRGTSIVLSLPLSRE
jgi:signal transduction histidine kinase